MIITLNGIQSTAYNITVSDVKRQLLPGRTAREITIPGRPGTYDFGSPDIGKRHFTFICHFEPAAGKTLPQTAQDIALWLLAATTLVLDDQPGIAWAGHIISAIDLDNMVALGKFTFTFEAQPYGEDTNPVLGTIGAAQDYGSNLPFAPVITVTMSAVASSLQALLVSTGQFVKLVDAIASGDIIVFDMSRGLVTRNGISKMPMVTIDSLFFAVPSGQQTILLTPSTGLTAQISYKRRYL